MSDSRAALSRQRPGTLAMQEADIKGYESLSPEYRAMLLAALQRQQGLGGSGTQGMSVEVRLLEPLAHTLSDREPIQGLHCSLHQL